MPNLPHPLVEVAGIPHLSYRHDLSDLVAAFVESATRTRTQVRRLANVDDLAELVDEILGTHAVERAVVSVDPEPALVAGHLRDRSIAVDPFSIEGAAAADLGVTGAVYGLAATGSIVLDSSRAGSRSAGLLPPVHLALLRESAIITDASALFRDLPNRLPAGLPSQLVTATGPSRSADIEQIITIGVHGPGHVWLGLLGPALSDSP